MAPWVVVALVLLLAAPAHGATVTSGSLRVDVAEDPFALTITDTADGDALRLSDAGPDGRGGLGVADDRRVDASSNAVFGYQLGTVVPGSWSRATRVVGQRRDGDAVELTLATASGREVALTIAPAGDGLARLRVRSDATATGLAFAPGGGGEQLLGFGSRSNAVDQSGSDVFSWAEEGPFSSGRGEELLRPLLPGFTFPSGPTGTNLPIPWLVSTRGLGVLVESSERSTFRLGDAPDGPWRVAAETGDLRLVFVAGPQPRDVVRRYSAFAGRQPRPAGWLLGPWVQFRGDQAGRFVAGDVPTTVSQTYAHYLPCGAQGDLATERARVQRAHDLGMKITTYFNPHVCTSYDEVYDDAAARGLFVQHPSGGPYLLTNPFTADQIVSEVDFTHPEGRALYGRLLDEALDAGYDGWMEDFGEYTPPDAVLHDGSRGASAHNRYPVDYHCTSYEHTRRRRGADLAVFIRSGFHGVQRCARAVWGGDPTEDWSCADGLCAAVHQLLNVGLSGIAYQGSDIGGFHAVVNGRTDDELTARWAQVGFVSGIMRTQSDGYAFDRSSRERRSQVWSPAVLPIWRRYAKLRTQLFPYLAAASAEYQRSGLPLARHLVLVAPGDPAARQHDVVGFGPDLLAAPVLRPGRRERTLRLPAGEWVDLWRSVVWDDDAGTVRAGAARLLDGGRPATLRAPLSELPLLLRAGAVLPLTAPDVDTLATLGDDRTVSLHERRRALRLVAFPRGSWSGRFYGRREGVLVSRETRRGWALRIRSTRRRTVDLEAALTTLRRPFAPRCATLDGRPVRFTFDPASRVLRARFAVRSGTLRVAPRCR